MSSDVTSDIQVVSIAEAVELLGIQAESIKRRLQRGTLVGERHPETGAWVSVMISPEEIARAKGRQGADVRDDDVALAALQDAQAALVKSLERTIEILETQLATAREEAQRRDTLHAQTLQLLTDNTQQTHQAIEDLSQRIPEPRTSWWRRLFRRTPPTPR